MYLDKTLLVCILRPNKGTDIFYDQSVQISFCWKSSELHFSLGLDLSLVCETGGQCWEKLLLKVMHYNIALLPKKVTNYVT